MWDLLFKRYWLNQSGNIAILSAFSISAALISVGAAVDINRLHSTASSLQDMSDNAALAAVSAVDLNRDKRAQLAVNTVSASEGALSDDVKIKSTVADVSTDGETVSVVVTVDVPQYFGKFLGKDTRQVQRSSLATRSAGPRNLSETNNFANANNFTPTSIVFVLDASGSMNANMGGTTRINVLKTSVRDIFAEFEANSDSEKRLRTGVYAYNWGIRDTYSQEVSNGWTQTIGKVNAMQLGNATIPTQALEVAVSDLISESDTIDGEQRDKVIVFMTDGEVDDHLNMNGKSSQYHPYNGEGGNFTQRTINACRKAHQAGFKIIAVGMDAPKKGRELLQQCVDTSSKKGDKDSVYINATEAPDFEKALRLATPKFKNGSVRLVR